MGETGRVFLFFPRGKTGYVNDLEMGLWCVLAKPRTHAGYRRVVCEVLRVV